MATCQEFPKDWHEFIKDNSFKDSQEVYTNGSELIPVFRVEQLIEHLLKEQEAVKPKVEKAILDYQSWHYICGDCGGQIDIHDNYCRHCGRVVAHLSNKI